MPLNVDDLDEDHLLRALDHLRDVFAVFDTRNRLVYWNDHCERRSGYSAEEFAGMRPEDLVADADLPKLARYLRQVDTTGTSTVEVRLVAKDGEEVPHELYSDQLTTADGSIVGRVVVGRDVSERQAYERVLRHKNARLEEFASFVSHDVRGPLTVASGWLERYHETGDETHYRKVVAAHERIAEVVDELLRWASYEDGVEGFESVDLGTTARAAWRTVRSPEAELRLDDPGTVVADRGLLTQALENLLGNAVRHGGETVAVRVGRLDGGEGFYVEDDGPGFPADELESLFEAGVTTSPDGTGLGLAIVEEIATMHGWTVAATTGVDGGARVEFTGVDGAPAGPDDVE